MSKPPKPNLVKLRGSYTHARNHWRKACAERKLDEYSLAAEGGYLPTKRGEPKQRDELGKLFDAMEAARSAWLGGIEQ